MDKSQIRNKWLKLLGSPVNFDFEKSFKLVKKYSFDDFDGEMYLQANGVRLNGETTYQRVFFAIPKNHKNNLPAVIVPFYFVDATLGFDLETEEELSKYTTNATMLDLVKRGYFVASADSYHLNYIDSQLDITDFKRWDVVGEAITKDHPEWTGMGKLVADTKLVVDVVVQDERVDKDNVGIMGHSLGGKMAFYTGCLDDRIKVICASDFGLIWKQSNWEDLHYWGKKLDIVKKEGLNNVDLLYSVAPKPFCLIAGLYDNSDSRDVLYALKDYQENRDKLFVVEHRAGHRPPEYAKQSGYAFLDYHLMNK